MTKIILSIAGILLLSTFAFSGNIPVAVQKAFEQKFPNATNVKWDKENSHEYEASFNQKGVKYSANFSESGEWLETESPTTFDKLPSEVQVSFNKSHKGDKVKTVLIIETAKEITKFEIEIKKGSKTVEFLYASDGNEIKQ